MTQLAYPTFGPPLRCETAAAVTVASKASCFRRAMGYFHAFRALKSVVVGVLVLFLWGRSYVVGESFHRGSDTQYIQIGSASGAMLVRFAHDGTPTKLTGTWNRARTSEPHDLLVDAHMTGTVLNHAGLGLNSRLFTQPTRGMIVNIMLPHWLVFLLAIPAAVTWVRRKTRESANETTTGPTDTREAPPLTAGSMIRSHPGG